MILYQMPIRSLVLQTLSYTFLDQTGTVILLSSYVSCQLLAKLTGQAVITNPATITSPSTGSVTATYAFPSPGTWQVQFVCYDGLGNPLYGEPLQIIVVKNEDIAGLAELLRY